MTAAELLASLAVELDQLRAILPADKQSWDDSPIVRLAVERLWITIGNTAEAYRKLVDVAPGVEPWSEMYGYRNLLAHAVAGDVVSDRVWNDTTADLDRIIAAVAAAAA